jgi:signal transduction histidine kinase
VADEMGDAHLTDAQRVVHELNNALTAINGYAEVVLRRLRVEDPLRPHVAEIHAAGLRAAELARTLTSS